MRKKRYVILALSAAAALSATACAKKVDSQEIQKTTASVEESEAETEESSETETSEKSDGTIVKLEANTPQEIGGNEFTLNVSEPDPNDADVIRVTAEYGDKKLELDECLYVKEIYQVKDGEENYVLVETSTYDDLSELYLIHLDEGKMELSDKEEGYLDGTPESVKEGFQIGSRLYVLGTYGGIRHYTLQNGKLEADGDMYQIKNPVQDYTITLTVAKEINCRLDGGNTTLKPGTKILPKAYSKDGTFYFELEDGTAGNLIVDLDADGEYAGTIGGVDESEIFSDLPYAS